MDWDLLEAWKLLKLLKYEAEVLNDGTYLNDLDIVLGSNQINTVTSQKEKVQIMREKSFL